MINKVIEKLGEMSEKELLNIYNFICKKELKSQDITLKRKDGTNLIVRENNNCLELNCEFSEMIIRPESTNKIKIKIIPDERTKYLNKNNIKKQVLDWNSKNGKVLYDID